MTKSRAILIGAAPSGVALAAGIQSRNDDISPFFTATTRQEAEVLKRILHLEATPEAIREFTRQRHKLGDYTYWFTLGTLWVSYTGHSDLKLWKRLFASQRPHRDLCLMKPSECNTLMVMPPVFPVFRAHRPGEEDWIAYTLSTDIAARFAKERGVQEIKAYAVSKADVCALFLRRGEQEVIVLDRHKPKFIQTIDIIYSEAKAP